MKKLFGSSLLLAGMIAASAFAQGGASVVGSWDMTVESPQGSRPSLLVIKKEGDKLTAVAKGARGERPFENISVKGNEITMVMTVPFQGQDMVITYKGKIENNQMKGEADFGGLASGEWSAVPHKEGAAAPAASPAPAAAPAGGGAANVSGTWNGTVETQAGSGTPTFIFKQEGESLTGTYKGQLGESPLKGTVKGSDISFTFKVNFQGQDFDVAYSGKIQADGTMKGKVKLGDLGDGDWTAKKQ